MVVPGSLFLLRPVLFLVPTLMLAMALSTLFLSLILFLVPTPIYLLSYYVILAQSQLTMQSTWCLVDSASHG